MINLNCLKKLMNAQTKVSIEILDQVQLKIDLKTYNKIKKISKPKLIV